MVVGDLVKIKEGHPYAGKIGCIVERTFQNLPPGTNKILVYKVLVDSIIINIPYRWMEYVNERH